MSLSKDTGLYSFDGPYQPVPAHRHLNPDGSIGGWVANTAVVMKDAYVAEGALVFGNARILAPAKIGVGAWVFGHAKIRAPVDVGDGAIIADYGIVNKQTDIRWGRGWSAYTVPVAGVSLRFWTQHPDLRRAPPTWLDSWAELPEALHHRGIISTLEYLAAVAEKALEPEPGSEPEREP